MFKFIAWLFSPIVAVLDFITKYFKTIVFLSIVYYFSYGSNQDVLSDSNASYANLQKIELFGPILSADKVLEDIEKAKMNDNIKGVLFIVNSPGGAVSPSVELMYAIKELRAIKPVVAYASGTMASGSYYASIYANKIYANPGSMIGSIGVIFQGANMEELMQKIGIKMQTVKVGSYKEAGTPTREWNTYERAELEKVINDTYDIFIEDVSKARGLKKSDHKLYADAHIFTSRQAKKVGLIDEVGNITAAKKYLILLSKVKDPVWHKQDKFDAFMEKIISEVVSNFAISMQGGLKAY
ncbi:MAG: signal peptide peptidase SppA [Campylobacteraceae bacterium]|nr:signal peptide peptidase SppA [Campylobacteraceae bacterium]